MATQLLFADSASFSTPLLAVFAVDIATGPDATPLPTHKTKYNSIIDES